MREGAFGFLITSAGAVAPLDRIVIHLHLHFPTEERIVIVEADETTTGFPVPFGATHGAVTTSSAGQNGASDNNTHPGWVRWEQEAYDNAMERFGSDLRQQGWPAKEEVAKVARGEGYSRLKNYNAGIHSPEERAKWLDHYVEVYLGTYDRLYQEEVKNGTLPDEITLQIQARASRDRDHLRLVGNQVTIVGTLAARDLLSSTDLDLSQPHTLNRVDQLVHAYQQVYLTGKEVRGGFFASQPFLRDEPTF